MFISALIIIALVALIFLLLTIFVSLITLDFFKGGYFAETSDQRLQIILDLAKLTPKDHLLDLGSGDGRIVIAATQQGARATGIEINPLLVWWSRLRLHFLHLHHKGQILQANIWNYNTKPYTVIVIYGIESMMADLEKKLLKELKPGTRVLSVAFAFPHWKVKKHVHDIRLYVR